MYYVTRSWPGFNQIVELGCEVAEEQRAEQPKGSSGHDPERRPAPETHPHKLYMHIMHGRGSCALVHLLHDHRYTCVHEYALHMCA